MKLIQDMWISNPKLSLSGKQEIDVSLFDLVTAYELSYSVLKAHFQYAFYQDHVVTFVCGDIKYDMVLVLPSKLNKCMQDLLCRLPETRNSYGSTLALAPIEELIYDELAMRQVCMEDYVKTGEDILLKSLEEYLKVRKFKVRRYTDEC